MEKKTWVSSQLFLQIESTHPWLGSCIMVKPWKSSSRHRLWSSNPLGSNEYPCSVSKSCGTATVSSRGWDYKLSGYWILWPWMEVCGAPSRCTLMCPSGVSRDFSRPKKLRCGLIGWCKENCLGIEWCMLQEIMVVHLNSKTFAGKTGLR